MVKRTSIPSPRRVICVDLDETLSLTLDALVRFHNSTYGTSLLPTDFTTQAYHEVWGGSREEAYLKIREFYRSTHFANIQPVQDGTLETLKTLKKRKFTLVIVTSRQQFIADQTKRFVDRHFPGIFESIYFCNHDLTQSERLQYISKSKSSICHEIGAEMLIDDSLDHAIECAAMGIDVLLFDLKSTYCWNHVPAARRDIRLLPPNIRRVTTWKAVQAQFPQPSSPLRYSFVPISEDEDDDDDDDDDDNDSDIHDFTDADGYPSDDSSPASSRTSDDDEAMGDDVTLKGDGFDAGLSLTGERFSDELLMA